MATLIYGPDGWLCVLSLFEFVCLCVKLCILLCSSLVVFIILIILIFFFFFFSFSSLCNTIALLHLLLIADSRLESCCCCSHWKEMLSLSQPHQMPLSKTAVLVNQIFYLFTCSHAHFLPYSILCLFGLIGFQFVSSLLFLGSAAMLLHAYSTLKRCCYCCCCCCCHWYQRQRHPEDAKCLESTCAHTHTHCLFGFSKREHSFLCFSSNFSVLVLFPVQFFLMHLNIFVPSIQTKCFSFYESINVYQCICLSVFFIWLLSVLNTNCTIKYDLL